MRILLNRRKFLYLTSIGITSASMPGAFTGAAAATPFNFQSSWANDAEFIGYFVALDKGYYAAEGLDLTYLPGGPDVIPESTLIGGKADLTLTTPETTVTAIVDQGAKFKIIGTQYQKNPIGIVSLAKTPVRTPKDMIGKKIAVPPVNVISIEAVLKLNGIDPKEVNFVPYAYDPMPIVKGEVDGASNFVTNVPYSIKQAGEEAVSFLLYDYGFTVYNDTVVVTEDTLKNRRKDLVGWLRASRKGWTDNFVDPAAWPPKFADTWYKGTGRTIDNEIYFNTAQKPLMEHANGIFAMDDEGIQKNIDALGRIGIKATKDMFDTSLLAEI